ncbi:unnamed protein product [Blepharisma stoltei]|uniref:Uncharacterized protein n=1 Tax=Blepharisma stoltei TaxID=1481888 RepID=A0AAU9IZH9_9CILI|nr:unnamed protein product [Blepharisma stoltei]
MGCCHASTVESDLSLSNPPSSRNQKEPLGDGFDNQFEEDTLTNKVAESEIFKLADSVVNKNSLPVLPTPTFGSQNQKPFKFEEKESIEGLPLPDTSSDPSLKSWPHDVHFTSNSKDY